MTDLEEEILFQLSKHSGELPVVALAEEISRAGTPVLLASLHRTLLQLDKNGFVEVLTSKSKRSYRITQTGIAALQRDWQYHSEQVKHA